MKNATVLFIFSLSLSMLACSDDLPNLADTESGEVLLEKFDAETGQSLKQTSVVLSTPRQCFFDFDHLNQDFAMNIGGDEVIYVDTETGETTNHLQSKGDVSPFLVWRTQ